MEKFYNLSLPVRMFVGIIAAIFCALVCNYFLSVIVAGACGYSLAEFTQIVQNSILNLEYSPLINYSLFVQSVSVFLVPSIVLLLAYGKKPFNEIGIKRRISCRLLAAIILMMLAFIPGINLLSQLNGSFVRLFIDSDSILVRLYEQNEALVKVMMSQKNVGDMFFQLFFLAVVPAVAEEFFFRGMMQTLFRKVFSSTHTAIIVTAALFSLMHGDVFNFVPRFIMGIILGYAFLWSGTIFVPTLVHFVHNGTVVLITYLINNKHISQTAEQVGAENNYIALGIFSLIVVGYVFFRYLNNSKLF